jgi:DNA invertase Pin-like site-specific DNA recombinase
VDYYTKHIAAQEGWELADIYADEGISGLVASKRDDFNRMIQDCRDGKIDRVIVKSISRFARNTKEYIQYVRELLRLGVSIHFEKENIDSLDPKCDMILSIYSSLAEEESRSISTNIRWSVHKRFEKGQVIMAFNNLLGYNTDENGKVIILEDEAETVRDIYTQFLLGMSYQNIINRLEGNKISTPRKKKKWSKSTIRSILSNEKYMGDAILQKTYKRDFLSEKRVKNTGQAEQRYVENNHPGIIDRETWNAAQAEMKRRNSLRTVKGTGRGRYSEQYAFSGKIECKICGARFRRHNHIYNGKRTHYWSCITHLDLGKNNCPQKPLKESYLEELFITKLNDTLKNKDKILSDIWSTMKDSICEESDISKDENNLKDIEIEIQKMQSQMMEITKKQKSEMINEESKNIMERLDELFIQREKLKNMAGRIQQNKIQQEEITAYLEKEKKATKFDKDIFLRLVHKVHVYDKENIVFELNNGMEMKKI